MNWRVNSQLWSEKHLSLCTVICWVKGILFWYKWQKTVVYVCSLQTFNPGLELNSLLYLTSLKKCVFFLSSFILHHSSFFALKCFISCSLQGCLPVLIFTFSCFLMMNIACKSLKVPVIPFPQPFHLANSSFLFFLVVNFSTTVRWKFTLSHPLIHWYRRSHPLLYYFKPHEHQMPWFSILVTYLWFFSSYHLPCPHPDSLSNYLVDMSYGEVNT